MAAGEHHGHGGDEKQEAEQRLRNRFAEYNVWRSIDHAPVEMAPLGFVATVPLALVLVGLAAVPIVDDLRRTV